MTAVTVNIPDSLHDQLQQLAHQQRITVDQFIATAVAEKMAMVDEVGYIAQRARRADGARFRDALAAIPDVPPEPLDEL